MSEGTVALREQVKVGVYVHVHAAFTFVSGGIVDEVDSTGFHIKAGGAKGLWFGWHELVAVEPRTP